MLLIMRCLLLFAMLILGLAFALVYCVVRPKHKNHVHLYASFMSWIAPVLGIKVILRKAKQLQAPCIFTANHQNNFDVFTLTKAVPKATVSLGKKSLVWMPLFGQIYWLTGNILIDRANRQKAFKTLTNAAKKIRERMLSVWVFQKARDHAGEAFYRLSWVLFIRRFRPRCRLCPWLHLVKSISS